MKNKIITLLLIAILLVAMLGLTACTTKEETVENNAVVNEGGIGAPPAKPAGGEHAPEDEGQAPKEDMPPPDGAEIVPPSQGEENIPAETPAE